MGIVGVAEKGFGIEHELSLSNRVYVAIGSVDADFFDTMGVRLIEGRLPENENEVIIPQMMTTAGKEFHIGDTITWQIGQAYRVRWQSHTASGTKTRRPKQRRFL